MRNLLYNTTYEIFRKDYFMKFYRFLISLTLSFLLCFQSIFISLATNTVDELEKETQSLGSELSDLNSQLAQLDKEIDSITNQISSTSKELEETKQALAIAKGEEEAQYELMKSRIKYIYENGDQSLLETLLESRSMTEFLNRAQYIEAVSQYDQQVLEDLESILESVADKEASLMEKEAELDLLQSQLEQKETTLRDEVSATETELAAYTQKLENAKEAAKKAEEEAKKEIVPVAPEIPESPTESEEAPSQTGSISASADDLDLFAALIECEAGTSHYEGMLAVASVVVNRMNNRYYPDTLRGVIFQAGQFTPVASGKVDKVLARGANQKCLQVAKEALAGKNNVGDCLSFRASYTGHAGIIIGDNVFF